MAKQSNRGRSKNKSIVYIVVLLAAGLFFGRMSNQIEGLVKGFLWILLGLAVALALLILVAYLKRDRALAALNGCDPETAIPLNEKKIASLQGKNLNEKQLFRLNIRLNNQAVAYHSLGDIPKAIEVLNEVELRPDSDKHSIFVVTHHNLAYYNLELGNMDAYEKECLCIRDFLAELPTEVANQYNGIFPHLEAKKQMLAGKYKKCLDYFAKSVEDESESSQPMLTRVVTRFELGVIYKELGDWELAKEQLEFVVNNGKNIKIAQEARALLAEPGEPDVREPLAEPDQLEEAEELEPPVQ